MRIPALTTEQMAEVDRMMIEVYHIELIQMMENAGRNLADCAQMLVKHQTNPSFLFACGSGNNGGGGLVAARHLINRGFHVDVSLINQEDHLKETPAHQWEILKQMGIAPVVDSTFNQYELIIDCMIGYGLQGTPQGNAKKWIEKINETKLPILALDVPSGLDATKGIPFHPCIQAAATLTLALPKIGLMTLEARPYVGNLYLADISVPDQLYQSIAVNVGPIFKKNSIIKIQ